MTKLSQKQAIKAAELEILTLTEEERKFLAACRRLPRVEAIAMFELVDAWHNGVGPDIDDSKAWLLNRAAEIEAQAAPMSP